MKKTFLVSAILVLVSCAGLCAEPARYGRSSMAAAGGLLDLVAYDMNGDGLKDLVTVSLTGPGGKNFRRTVDIFYQKKAGGFTARPDASWALPDDAAVFDVGAATGDGKGSVCYLAADGMYAYLPGKSGYSGKPVRLISADSVFTGRDLTDMPHLPFLSDDGKGGVVALVPGMSGLGIYRLSQGSFTRTSEPSLPVETTFSGGHRVGADSSLTVSHKVPVFSVTGFNDQDAADIIMNWDDNALVYLRRKDGAYPGKADLSFMPGLLQRPVRDPMEGAWLQPADIDGDGRLDFVVIKKTGGIAHTRSFVFIYRRLPDGRFPEKPSHSIITEGVVGPRFVDLGGDGRIDILLPSIKVGVSNFINMLTSGTVNVEIDIYMQDGSGSFPERPTKTKTVGFKLDISNLTRAAPVMETGRFSRDGGYGLAVVSDEDTVSLFVPDRYSILSDRPGVEFDVDAPTEMTVDDLNGDGVDDLILSYKKSDKLSRNVNVFLSEGI